MKTNRRKTSILGRSVHKKLDGRLGYSIYRKPTHTDLYLDASRYLHPSQKMGVLNALIHKVHQIADAENLQVNLSHLEAIFKSNGYSTTHQEI